jgi:hypothetical protein
MASVVASAAFLAGVALFVVGAWAVYPPAGLMVLGLVLMLGAWNYVKGSWASSSG